MYPADAQHSQSTIDAAMNPCFTVWCYSSIVCDNARTQADDKIKAAAKNNGSCDQLWQAFSFQAEIAVNIKTNTLKLILVILAHSIHIA